MEKKTIIRTRYIPKTVMERSLAFPLVGSITHISEHGIQIKKRDTDTRFWIDTDHYVVKNEVYMDQTFEKKQEVKTNICFTCYINKANEFSVKAHLLDIEPIESLDAWTYGLLNEPLSVQVNIKKIYNTDTNNLFILEGNRVDEQNREQEKFIFRYFARDLIKPQLGTFTVTFNLILSSKIILTNGEIYNDEEEYTMSVDGVQTIKRSPVYVMTLEATTLVPKE